MVLQIALAFKCIINTKISYSTILQYQYKVLLYLSVKVCRISVCSVYMCAKVALVIAYSF